MKKSSVCHLIYRTFYMLNFLQPENREYFFKLFHTIYDHILDIPVL